MKTKQFRQGDVLVEGVDAIPADARPKARTGPVVLAYGEVTGHSHQIIEDGLDIFEAPDGTMYLSVTAEAGVDLRHEEHATVHLPKGRYRRSLQREYSPEEIRNVRD